MCLAILYRLSRSLVAGWQCQHLKLSLQSYPFCFIFLVRTED
nr:MAG TPA: hypothetical protein [Caudoviricetes sp.]